MKDAESKAKLGRELGNDGQWKPVVYVLMPDGSEHAFRLIQNHVAGKKLLQRLVVAYLIGMKLFKHSNSLPVCKSPTATQCMISWQSYANGGDPNAFPIQTAYSPLSPYNGEEPVCVNPLSWKSNTVAVSAKYNNGSKDLFQWHTSVLYGKFLLLSFYPPLSNESHSSHEYDTF